jgi:hypothetical protein
MPQPDGKQAEDQREDGVQTCFEPFAVSREVERLKAERGKGGVASTDANHEPLSETDGCQPAPIGASQRRKKTNGEGARDVDDQGAPRECFAKMTGNEARPGESRDAAQTAAQENPDVAHDEYLPWIDRFVTEWGFPVLLPPLHQQEINRWRRDER